MKAPVQIEEFLNNIKYPLSKEKLLEKAKRENVDDFILNLFKKISIDKFKSSSDVTDGMFNIK